MKEAERQGAKQAARDLYRAGRITLETAIWALENAGYSREKAAEWLETTEDGEGKINGKNQECKA
jgi:hypothetical protein